MVYHITNCGFGAPSDLRNGRNAVAASSQITNAAPPLTPSSCIFQLRSIAIELLRAKARAEMIFAPSCELQWTKTFQTLSPDLSKTPCRVMGSLGKRQE